MGVEKLGNLILYKTSLTTFSLSTSIYIVLKYISGFTTFFVFQVLILTNSLIICKTVNFHYSVSFCQCSVPMISCRPGDVGGANIYGTPLVLVLECFDTAVHSTFLKNGCLVLSHFKCSYHVSTTARMRAVVAVLAERSQSGASERCTTRYTSNEVRCDESAVNRKCDMFYRPRSFCLRSIKLTQATCLSFSARSDQLCSSKGLAWSNVPSDCVVDSIRTLWVFESPSLFWDIRLQRTMSHSLTPFVPSYELFYQEIGCLFQLATCHW